MAVTPSLERLRDYTRLSEEDGSDYVPTGFYWIAPVPDEKGGYYTEATRQYLVKLKDVINTQWHTARRRLNGCCGLDGCDGKNILCQNCHELGTERSNCWIAHSLALDPNAITAEPHETD